MLVMSSRVHSNSYSGHRSPRPSFSRQLRNRCSLCIRVFKWLPVLFIVSVLCWGYYAYVIQLNLINIESVIIKALYLSVFHVIYVLTMWSYWQTIFTESAHIPRDVYKLDINCQMFYSFFILSVVLVTVDRKGKTITRV